ncbi:ROK family protein [Streptomyces ipomoeae]|uniref:ROK family protein n=1 Tax=Streptomyces ipomoeae TaxID=103232 RepID=UPI0011466044|nr:ROK family protein [Streptomyces ipomoeae]MDX2695679.1 ROK family protein [Streptomyces ipomoeae]MDX2840984.1 ROK family protein [Streptomyces ipomoeae]MDX2933897.1 ROK family protein [Streptomyces ipomoeae]TQE28842.1 ROK family protein [Streptomyces ipomoeae]
MHLSESARAVFAVLAEAGTATRPQLAAGAGLSKPTVSSAVAELEAAGLAACSGTASGGTGRSAAVYGLGLAAGAVLAVDLGPSRTQVRGCALDGTLLAQGSGSRPDAAGVVSEVLAELPDGAPLRAVVVAVGDVTVQAGEGERPATAKAGPAFDAMAVALPPGVPVHLENNVNCAALAELHEGAARGRDTFGYLRIGVGIGLGVVIGGQVLRGANHAAGEVARLPYPWDEDREPRHEGLEAHLGARSLLRRAADAWRDGDGPRPRTVERLFALADGGHATACAVVGHHAAEVGRLAAAATAVLDPGLMILGGDVGSNPQLLPGVRAELARLSWPTEVVSSALGDSGTVVGATELAVARGIQNVTEGVPVKH